MNKLEEKEWVKRCNEHNKDVMKEYRKNEEEKKIEKELKKILNEIIL